MSTAPRGFSIERMSDIQVLKLMQHLEKERARYDAFMVRALARFVELRPDTRKYVGDEIGAALGWSPSAASAKVQTAVNLMTRLPDTVAALERGDLDLAKARAIEEWTEPLSVSFLRRNGGRRGVRDRRMCRGGARRDTREVRSRQGEDRRMVGWVDHWLTFEVFDGEGLPASAWRRAHGDALTEVAVTNGARQWGWHEHRWGVVLEVEFTDEDQRDRFRGLPAVRAALDAVPDPAHGLLVYPGRGGGSGSRIPRWPRPIPSAGAGALPEPHEEQYLQLTTQLTDADTAHLAEHLPERQRPSVLRRA